MTTNRTTDPVKSIERAMVRAHEMEMYARTESHPVLAAKFRRRAAAYRAAATRIARSL